MTLYAEGGGGGGYEGGQAGQSLTECAGGGGSSWWLDTLNGTILNPLSNGQLTTVTATGSGTVVIQGLDSNLTAVRSASVVGQAQPLSGDSQIS